MDVSEIADRWPAVTPTYGNVTLRAFRPEDASMAMDLSRDPYVPATGTLPLNATRDQAQQWMQRQQTRHTEGKGFSFAVVDNTEGRCAGFTGLWVRELHAGRAQIGYSIAPSFRGRHLASDALHVSHPSPGHFPSCIARSSTSSPGTQLLLGQRSEPGISARACSGPTRRFPASDATCCCTPTCEIKSEITLGAQERAIMSQPRPGA